MVKKIICFLLGICFITDLLAQQVQEIEMADQLRASGKIYVVVAVLLVIFFGIVIYLVGIDRKVSRLEKEINKNSKES